MTTEEKILKVIAENMEKKIELKMENSIKESGIDSLGFMIILDALEDELGIKLEAKEFAGMKSIGEIADHIKAKAEGK